MLTIQVFFPEYDAQAVASGRVYNVSHLNARSNYQFAFQGRSLKGGARPRTVLGNYPRWSEPARALMARCLNLTARDAKEGVRPPPAGLNLLRVEIHLDSRGVCRLLSELTARRQNGSDRFQVDATDLILGGKDATPKAFWTADSQPSCHLVHPGEDAWDLAQRALRASVWGAQAGSGKLGRLAAAKPLRPPIFPMEKDPRGFLDYIRLQDIACESARATFAWRVAQGRQPRPCVPGVPDAYDASQWHLFLNGML